MQFVPVAVTPNVNCHEASAKHAQMSLQQVRAPQCIKLMLIGFNTMQSFATTSLQAYSKPADCLKTGQPAKVKVVLWQLSAAREFHEIASIASQDASNS